jgi:hypothetical protein
MIHATKPYLPNATYWLLVGMEDGKKHKFVLLGRFIRGRFEFRNNDTSHGYIYRSDLPDNMMPPPLDDDPFK